MFIVAKSLGNQGLHKEAIEAAFKLLNMLGEARPRPIGDPTLKADMKSMKSILENTTDEAFAEMKEATMKKDITHMRVYAMLCRTFHYLQPSLFAAASLRLVELTMSYGYCFPSPLAFAFYGQFLTSLEEFELANRLGA